MNSVDGCGCDVGGYGDVDGCDGDGCDVDGCDGDGCGVDECDMWCVSALMDNFLRVTTHTHTTLLYTHMIALTLIKP